MVTGIIFLILFAIAYIASPKPAKPVSYIADDLKKMLKPIGWKGTPVDAKGRFLNYEHPSYQNFLKILIWLPGHFINLIKNRNVIFPVVHHTSADILQKDQTLIWLGHASFFIRIDGISILIDPHFNNTFIYKRHTDNPFNAEHFQNIQYILLSHDHADHCDKKSLQLLIKNNPQVTILCGLNMDGLIKSFIKQDINILTAKWYEAFPIGNLIEIYFVPSNHYSKQLFRKFNSTLWGGFVIRYKDAAGLFQTIYYCGDSGYGNHFKDIEYLFHPNLAILPVGAYKPRWFMKQNHMTPDEACRALKDCGAHKMLLMHYQTFNLSNENMNEPLKDVKQFISEEKLINLMVGEEYKL